MPRSFTTDLRYAKSERPTVPLVFVASRHTGTQASVRGRTALKPAINLSRFRFKAVIDWIDVVVTLGRPTQFRYLQEFLNPLFPRRCRVEAIDSGPGGVADRFIVRIQEPASVAAVAEACDAIARKFGRSSATLVTAIEISVDARPHVLDDRSRALLLGVMQRTIFTSRDIYGPELSRPRYHTSAGVDPVYLFPKSGSRGKTLDIWLHTTGDRPAPIDSTLSLGALADPIMVKLMDKVIDRQNRQAGTYEELVDVEKRVRIEVTLRRPELSNLGVTEIADLRDFSYASLQGRCFQFKLPTFRYVDGDKASALTAVRREIEERRLKRFLSTGVIGLTVRRNAEKEFRSSILPEMKRQFRREGKKMRRDRRGAGSKGTLVAYEELNRLVSDALWSLAKRERTAWERTGRR